MTAQRQLGPLQLFTLAFGTIAGIAWVFLTGPWLASAGSIGTTLALAIGAAVMLPIVSVYAALARRIPGGGGEILYAATALGPRLAFIAGWILAACYIGLVAFILVTVAWLVDVCLANIAKQFAWQLRGTRGIGLGVAALSFALVIAANYRGVAVAARLQDIIIGLKLLAVLALATLSLTLGDARNLEPWFARNASSSGRGFVQVLIASPFLYAGFNTAVQAMAEMDMRRLHLVRRAFQAAVLCAAAFYSLIVISVAIAMPRATLLSQDLPALSGLAEALNTPLATAFVGLIALLALAGCWNGVLLAGCKVLIELARRRELAAGPLEESRGRALIVMVVCALAIAALGRDAVLVTVGTVSFFMALAFALACISLWRLADGMSNAASEKRMAAAGALVSGALVVLALTEMVSGGAFVTLSLIAVWLALGALISRRHHAAALE